VPRIGRVVLLTLEANIGKAMGYVAKWDSQPVRMRASFADSERGKDRERSRILAVSELLHCEYEDVDHLDDDACSALIVGLRQLIYSRAGYDPNKDRQRKRPLQRKPRGRNAHHT
jgi:hypothetical protein